MIGEFQDAPWFTSDGNQRSDERYEEWFVSRIKRNIEEDPGLVQCPLSAWHDDEGVLVFLEGDTCGLAGDHQVLYPDAERSQDFRG